MKEYILQKYKKYNKFSVFGGGDETKKYYARLQANADNLVNTFTRLTPPLASDLKLSSAKLTACDVVSEGPIEGFVNKNGESCSPLEAIYLDGTVIAEPGLVNKTIEKLTFNKLNQVVYDYSSFVSGELDDYAQDLQNRFVHREYIPTESWLTAISSKRAGTQFRGGRSLLMNKLNNILNCEVSLAQPFVPKPMDNMMVWNPGQVYAAENNLGRAYSVTATPSDSSMSYRKAGYGYRKMPYQTRKIYYPDVMVDGYSMPNPYVFSTDKPVLYQGSYTFGASINNSGRIGRSYCSRAFFSFTRTADNAHSSSAQLTDIGRYIAAGLKIGGGTLSTLGGISAESCFPNGKPSKYRYKLARNSEPDGLKEPIIDSISEKLNNIGIDYFKPYRFYDSSITLQDRAGPLIYEDRNGEPFSNSLYNTWESGGLTLTRTTISGKSAEEFKATRDNNSVFTNEYPQNNPKGRCFQPGKTYRITGSFYIPSSNSNINCIYFQSIDNGTKNYVRITGNTTEYPADTWNDFDFEIPHTGDHGSLATRLRIRFYENGANPTNGTVNDKVYLNNLSVLEKTSGDDSVTNSGNFAYMCFKASDFFGTNFNKDYELTYAVDGDRLEINDKNGLGFSYPEVTGFDVELSNVKESFSFQIDPNPECFIDGYGPSRFLSSARTPIITGSSNSFDVGKELSESKSNKFKGAFLYPVYLGEKFIPLQSNGTVNTGIIFIEETDSATVSGNKVASGISGDYDVFAIKSGNFQYVHVANPNIKVPNVEVTGKNLELRLQEKDPTFFNFSNFDVDFNLGEENQQPLTKESVTAVEYNKNIYGPNNPNQTFDDSLILTGSDNNYNSYGMREYSAIDGTHSQDIQSDGSSQSDWMDNIPLDADSIEIVHTVTRRSVDCIKVTFIIEELYQDIIAEQDPLQSTVKQDALQINFSVFTSFDGVPDDIFAPVEKQISYYGIVTSFYAADSEEITLPSYDDIVDSYPNEDKESLAKRFPRKVVIRKNDFETTSARLGRSARVFQVLEIIKESFSYPFSAVMKTQIDARAFKDPPNKQYQLRLRKVQIPSNYFPLNLDGKDKRFVGDENDLGTRIVYEGDWDGTFKIGWTDNPAWILYDILTNQRYGIGTRIDDIEDINIFNLYKIGRYCDAVDDNGHFVGVSDGLGGLEPRFSCNIVLDAANNAFNTLKDIASVFNGMVFWANGRLDFFADQPKEPMMFFNNGNVFDGVFNYQTTNKSSLFNVADVTYLDKRDDFTAKQETIIDEDGMRANGIVRRAVNARGATSRAQAARLGRYILYSNKLEREVVNFKAPSQALMLSIGDIIEVQDELKNFEANYAKVLEKDFGGTTFAAQGGFQYFRFVGANSDNTATADSQAIIEIHFIDSDGTTYPTVDFSDSDLAAGGSDTTGPYVQGGLSVTAGYSYSQTYGPHEPFGGNNMWWTLGLSDASLNYLDVDFGSAKNISQIQVQVVGSFHESQKLRILASNDASFNTFTVFGEIIDIANASYNLTIQAGTEVTVSEGGSTSISNFTYSAAKSLIIENRPNTNSIINNHSGAFVIVPTGQDKLSELYNHIISGGFIGNQELSGLYVPQVKELKITGVSDLTTKIRLGVEDPSGYLDHVPTGTLINLDLQNRTPKQYRVLKINPEETNLYSVTATEYRREKFDLIENQVNFTLDDPEPFGIGIPENEIKALSEPEGFSSQVVDNNYGQQIDFSISGNLTGNETAYEVSVIQPNGNIESKKIAKAAATENGYFKTTGTFKDITSFGTYTFEVKSIEK